MQEQDFQSKIEFNVDRLRSDPRFTSLNNTKLFELVGAIFGIEKLESIFQDKDLFFKLVNLQAITAPTYVYKFIKALIDVDNTKSIFDPYFTISSPLLYINSAKIYGTCSNHVEYEAIKNLFKVNCQNIRYNDSLSEPSKNIGKFDYILSFPPFGMGKQIVNRTKSQFDFAIKLLLDCSDKIENEGKIVFLVSNSFWVDDKGKVALREKGLFIEAVFSVPSSAFAPIKNIQSNLILISKTENKKTFVAEISHDETTNKTIIQNFRNKKEGSALQLGCFVDVMEFKSFNKVFAEKELEELLKKSGYPSIRLIDISLSINSLKGDNSDGVKHLSNSIYLPKIGNSLVVTSLSELKLKPTNYFQIQLDDKKANSIYLANYFNTPVGKKLRSSLEVGATVPHISRGELLKCQIFLPDLQSQAQLIEVDDKIQQYTFKLEELHRNLWKQPHCFKSIAKDLESINHEDQLVNWIDNLPFPISSILWRFHATKDNGKKIEHLFHFFEAFSEFLSMLMLSALVQDKEFYKEESYKWIDKEEKFKNWYLKATFGNWNNLTSNLSKAIRVYLGENDKKDFCKNLFGNPSDSFLSMITSKGIVNILFEVATLRNDWKGHGGITSERENSQRVLTLGQKLNEFRRYISDAFENTKILSPTTGSFEDGVFTFNAKELIGARTPFQEIVIKSLIALDRKKLYLSNSQQTKPLELLPFIKFIEASDAIYFYTRIESKDVRWVSYHFDKESELKQPADTDLFKAFDFLKP